MQKIIVILGPTASSKSDIAVSLAKKFNGEIVSADSRQVYRELNIGTGKITKKEMKGVRHYLLDVASPNHRFTASEYKKLAEKAIRKILVKGKIPIICGGTGFYIDALLGDKQIPEVPPNQKLQKQLEKKPVEELFEILKKLDPERAKNIDSKNPRRLVRAIEICKALGKVPPLRPDFAKATPDKQNFAGQAKYDAIKIGIAPQKEITHPNPSLILREGPKGKKYILDEEKLKERINKRIEKWFKMGLLKEVQNLHKKGLSWKRMGEIGLEYKIVSLFLQNKISKQEMIERMQIETYQYAKRQMTWFHKTKNVFWLPSKIGMIEKEVKRFL
jgi:tRNA dimethylallyltransferase